MKMTAMIVAAAGLASALQAAPQESVTFTDVGSFNRFGVAGNTTVTATFTGAYNVARINVTGTLTPAVPTTNSFAREACIQATSPTGQRFIINPFTATTLAAAMNVPANAYTQLPTAEAAAGVWTFEFFELFDDNAGSLTVADATWTSITLTLDDATVAAPPAPIPTNPSVTWTNVPSTVGFNSASPTPGVTWTRLTFDVPASQTQIVDTAVFSGQATGVLMNSALTAGNNATGTPTNYALIRVMPPWGDNATDDSQDRFTGRAVILVNGTTSSSSTGTVSFFPVGLSSLSTASATATNNPPFQGPPIAQTTGPAAGRWTVEVQQNFASGTLGPINTAFWQSLSMSLASSTPPTLAEPGFTLLDGGTITKSGTFAGTGEKKWYLFTVPAGTTITRANGNALDVGMFGTALSPANDTSLAIYTSTGGLFATSFNTGPDLLPQLSFGQGIRNPQGLPTDADPGLPFDGANPAGAPPNNFRPDLTPGNYYVLVNNGDAGVVFRNGLFNSDPTTATNTGPYSVMFRSWLSSNTAPFDAPPATDIGTIGGPLMTTSATLDAQKRYKWLKFTIDEAANDTTGKYLDIDTVPTPAPMNDTNFAIYNTTGGLVALNDDINAWTAANPLGGNSAVSFGSSSPTRDYSGISADLAAYPGANGGDGYLAAGTYYIQVSLCCANYTNDRFWVINDYVTGLSNGDITLNFRSNYPALPTQCSPADVGVQGGGPGQDNLLNNNDFIAFIDLFFASAPAADLGSQGGVQGADGQWNNNDFIVFIDYFFNDAALCQG